MAAGDSEMALAVVPGASNWVQLGPQATTNGQSLGLTARILVTGRLTGLAIDPTTPTTMYAAAARGGVWKSTDGGDHWSPISDNETSLAIGAIALAPSSPNVLYAGTGEGNLLRYQQAFSLSSAPATYQGAGVMKSTDGGASWTQQAPPAFVGAAFFRIAVHPTNANTAWAASSAGLFRTIDGGTTWVPMTSGLPPISPTVIAATDVVIDPSNPANVWVAFFGAGVFKSANGLAAAPTFVAQPLPLPTGKAAGRIALALAPSSPTTVYALVAGGTGLNLESILGLYVTSGGGAWTNTLLAVSGFGAQSSYNLNVAVDPTTPDIVYLSELTLWKATRNASLGTWSKADLGQALHADHHSFAFDPTSHLVLYDLSDGGIYKSTDGGASWSDKINREICVTQFEFIDQHPGTDAVVLGGTQDNGTEMYRASQVFYHSDEGDGGCVAIDPVNPRNMFHGYFSTFIARSTTGGEFGATTWQLISDTNANQAPVRGTGIFYPPFALDPGDANTIVVGTDRLNFDAAQGTLGFPTANEVTFPGITGVAGGERISTLNFATSLVLYVGTTAGKVFRVERASTVAPWSVRPLHGGALPSRWIWDIAVLPAAPGTLVVAMGTFGIQHVWQGVMPASGPAAWTPISGTGASALPDAPCNALQIDPATGNLYVATDIGVFTSTNGGATWSNFSQGLPNVAAYDLDLYAPEHLLRAGTHGRGIWERRIDVNALPDIELYVRDHILHSGRAAPPNGLPSPFANPLQGVAVGDPLWVWQCADIKVDAVEGSPLKFQTPAVADVEYVFFESQLSHRNPQRGRVNRVYVQVHNRGIQSANNVVVKLLYTAATAGAPPLPADFWTAFPGDPAPGPWIPIGSAQTIPLVAPNQPVIVEWDWTPPPGAAEHSCLLAVIDCAADPLPSTAKVLDIWTLANNERRVGWKNVHIIDALPGLMAWSPLWFSGAAGKRFSLRFAPAELKGWQVGIVLPKVGTANLALAGVTRKAPSARIKDSLRRALGDSIEQYDLSAVFTVSTIGRGAAITNLVMPKRGFRPVLMFAPSATIAPVRGAITVLQAGDGDRVIGGSTYVLHVAS